MNETMKKQNREKNPNFIVYLNDNEVKWYSHDTITLESSSG